MSECFSDIFFKSGELKKKADFEDSIIFGGLVFYEVVRVCDGIPLFLSDHFERLENSIHLGNREFLISYEKLRVFCLKLIEDTGINYGNIKIVFNYSEGESNWFIYFVDAQYPDTEQYKNGVKGIIYHAERQNPMAKVFNHQLRSSIYSRLIHYKAWEALLVNRNNCLTEGSRSNLFFIEGEKFITAPDNCILGGITRKKILKICREEGIDIEFRCLPLDELKNVSSVIMTGTSASLLPFNEIDNIRFNTYHSILEKVSALYQELMRKYIINFK